jgi:hypothetical protein
VAPLGRKCSATRSTDLGLSASSCTNTESLHHIIKYHSQQQRYRLRGMMKDEFMLLTSQSTGRPDFELLLPHCCYE